MACVSAQRREVWRRWLKVLALFLNESVAADCCWFALKALYLKINNFHVFIEALSPTICNSFFFFSFNHRIQCKLQIWRSFSCWEKWSLQSHTIWSSWTLQSSQQYLVNTRAVEESSWTWIWNVQVKKFLRKLMYHDKSLHLCYSVIITVDFL